MIGGKGSVGAILKDCCDQYRAKGFELLDLSMINPDIPPPKLLLDRLIEASLKPVSHRYTAAKGLDRLRKAFVYKYSTRFGINLDPESEVCITDGSKDAIISLLSILKHQGSSDLILPSPTYPAYITSANLIGGYQLSSYRVDLGEDYMIKEIESLLQLKSNQVLIVNFPNNPTGVIISKDSVKKILDLADIYQATIISDFVYGEVGIAAPYTSFLIDYDRTKNLRSRIIEVYSLSKAYSIPGWRLAGVVGDSGLVEILAKRKALTGYGIFSPLQLAAATALRAGDSIARSISEQYQERQLFLSNKLKSLEFDVSTNNAGSCLWAKLPRNLEVQDSLAFAQMLIEKQQLVVLPGQVFGELFANYIRIALVKPLECLDTAATKIAELISTIPRKKTLVGEEKHSFNLASANYSDSR